MTIFSARTSGQLTPILRALRRGHGLSQSGLGSKVGLSQERISAIENHPERVTVDQILTILMALDAEVVIRPRQNPGAGPSPPASDALDRW